MHVCEGLIYAGIESADAQVLIIRKAEEGFPGALDVPIQLGDIFGLVERRTEISREGRKWGCETHGRLQCLCCALRVEKVEDLVLNKPTAEVPTILIAPKLQSGLSGCNWCDTGRGSIAAPVVKQLAMNIIGAGLGENIDRSGLRQFSGNIKRGLVDVELLNGAQRKVLGGGADGLVADVQTVDFDARRAS